jgi:hypothetical protein
LQRWQDAMTVVRATAAASIVEDPAIPLQQALEAQITGLREVADLLRSQRTHTGKAAGLSQARERWRVYDVAREVQAAC